MCTTMSVLSYAMFALAVSHIQCHLMNIEDIRQKNDMHFEQTVKSAPQKSKSNYKYRSIFDLIYKPHDNRANYYTQLLAGTSKNRLSVAVHDHPKTVRPHVLAETQYQYLIPRLSPHHAELVTETDESTHKIVKYLTEKLNQFDVNSREILIHKINELIFDTEIAKLRMNTVCHCPPDPLTRTLSRSTFTHYPQTMKILGKECFFFFKEREVRGLKVNCVN